MKNKRHTWLMCLLLLVGLVFTSCNNDDNGLVTDGPSIDFTKVGDENSYEGNLDALLPLQAEIEAGGKIKSIDLTIENEDDATNKIELSFTDQKYLDKTKVGFQENVTIPKDLPEGKYRLELRVRDHLGKSGSAKTTISLAKKGPKLANLKVGEKDFRDNGLANVYLKLYIAGDLTSDSELESIVFSAAEKDGGDGKLETKELISYYKSKEGKLDANVDIPIDAKLGNYTMLLTLKDAEGNVREVTKDIKVNGVPTVEGFELGSGHSAEERVDGIGKAGDRSGLHTEATIYAVLYRLKGIKVTITQDVKENPYQLEALYTEDMHYDMVTHQNVSGGYFGALYGARNDHFHEHIFLPGDMPLGDYNYVMRIEDREGQVFEVKKKLKVIAYK